MKTICAAVLALCLTLGAADVLKMPLSDTAAMENVMNFQLANGLQPRRRLAEADPLSQALAATHLSSDVFTSFIDGLISEAANFSSFTQDELANFNFSALGALTMDTPITAFLAELQQKNPKNLSGVEDVVADIFNEFCTAATCVAESEVSVSSKVSTSKDLSFNKTAVAVLTKESRCISKTATLALEPWSCTFDLTAEEKAVTCTPAILVLQKTPAYCDIELGTTIFDKLGVSKVADKIDSTFTSASAMAEAFVYTGKSCSVVKTFGKDTIDIYGADPFSINLGAMLSLSGSSAISTSSTNSSSSLDLAAAVAGSADVTATGGR